MQKAVWGGVRREPCECGSVKSVPPLVVNGLKVESPVQKANALIHNFPNIQPLGH